MRVLETLEAGGQDPVADFTGRIHHNELHHCILLMVKAHLGCSLLKDSVSHGGELFALTVSDGETQHAVCIFSTHQALFEPCWGL